MKAVKSSLERIFLGSYVYIYVHVKGDFTICFGPLANICQVITNICQVITSST